MKNLGLRISGLVIISLAMVGLIATILLSISGGAKDYINLNSLFNSSKTIDQNELFKFSGFVVTTVFIQLMIFVVSAIATIIINKFNKHNITLGILQSGLLIVSIYYNYNFFGHGLIKLILCILLDLSVIKLVSLGIDLITLNYSYKKDLDNLESLNFLSLLKMFIFNKLATIRLATIRDYNFNRSQINYEISKENSIDSIEENIVKSENKDDLKQIEGQIEDDIKQETEKKEDVSEKNDIVINIDKYQNNKVAKLANKETEKNKEEFENEKQKEKKELLDVIFENLKDDFVCPSISFLENNTSLSKNKINELRKEFKEKGILKTYDKKTIVNVSKEKAKEVL